MCEANADDDLRNYIMMMETDNYYDVDESIALVYYLVCRRPVARDNQSPAKSTASQSSRWISNHDAC